MTRKIFLIAGVAGLALTAPASAEKGDRNADRANAERGGGQAQRAERPQRAERQQAQRAERPQRAERQQVQRAERPQRAERQQVQRAERPQRAERQQIQRAERPQRAERQQIQRAERPQRAERQRIQRAERPQRAERQQVQRADRPQRVERAERVERQQQRVERQAQRPQRIERQQQRAERQSPRFDRQNQRVERQTQRVDRQGQRFERQVQAGATQFDGRPQQRFDRNFARSSFGSREMRPMAPFRAKVDDRRTFEIGERIVSTNYLAPVPTFFASNYVDTSDYYHRYDNDYGYVYRVNRDDGIVRGLMPLFGGYGMGDPWPQTYYSSYVPAGYRDYYYDTPDYYYRNDGYGIYQVDAGSQLIRALVSLVMGQGYGIGQALPSSYGAYNVPLDYRANYYDTNDSWYRYGDGFIYQMDPGSRLISARYPLYSDNYYVGQAWPVAYPDYNVPYGYQSAYADTPQYHYRYANGGIYQVDPTNQLIMALVALVSGDQFAVGQRMPTGYDMYNVPLDYRDRYADSDDEYYRYANGHVYRVDADSWLIREAYPIYG